jgi:hypothetical protein
MLLRGGSVEINDPADRQRERKRGSRGRGPEIRHGVTYSHRNRRWMPRLSADSGEKSLCLKASISEERKRERKRGVGA